jgi:pimeloyl-ACP methyl ester carboxylesterase
VITQEQVPAWFVDACATVRDDTAITVDGCRIVCRAWGERGRPVVVLVHGGAAHAGWWDHVGPYLAVTHRVVALDLSGHGDSGHRESYSIGTWATEVLAVAAAESGGQAVLIGHSMGGLVVLAAAGRAGSALRGVAAVDIVPESAGPGGHGPTPRPPGAVHRVHGTREIALSRFRTLPDDDSSLPFVRDHLAASSIKPVDGGWTWKFDPNIMTRARVELDDVDPVGCNAAVIRGERGLGTARTSLELARRLGPAVPVTTIPDAGHHIMLDQPIALIATLQTLLGQWTPRHVEQEQV